jgi:hypothetical protein
MGAARFHVDPAVRMTGRRHMPPIGLAQALTIKAGALTSANWSGQALANGNTAFSSSSFGQILAQWVVSGVQQPVGTCSGTDVSSTWVGIDGLTASTDVLQAGTEGDAACSNGITTENYYPWFEWYPGYEYEITNFPILRGTSIYVIVEAISATTANATYINLQTNQYTVVGFKAPAGVLLRGNSAEWIIERPTLGSILGTLADFGIIAMTREIAIEASEENTWAFNYPGSPGIGQTGYTLTMLDSAGNALANSGANGNSAQVVYADGAAQ